MTSGTQQHKYIQYFFDTKHFSEHIFPYTLILLIVRLEVQCKYSPGKGILPVSIQLLLSS